MRSAVIAVILLVAYCEAKPRPSFASGPAYIIGGENADITEFPHQISLQRVSGSSASHSCGGSLLSPNYVLTAAHCVDGALPSRLRVVAGVTNRTATDGVSSGVASYKTHEQYQRRNNVAYISDDIAILTLSSPIYANGVTIKYAKLPASADNLFVGQEGYITGWGRTDATGILPQILQKARITVLGKDECNERLKPLSSYFVVDDTQICLYDPNQQTRSCNGDSGGPFTLDAPYQGTLAGLSSWSPKGPTGVCITGVPVVYTRVSAFLDWISANTQ